MLNRYFEQKPNKGSSLNEKMSEAIRVFCKIANAGDDDNSIKLPLSHLIQLLDCQQISLEARQLFITSASYWISDIAIHNIQNSNTFLPVIITALSRIIDGIGLNKKIINIVIVLP